MSCLTVSNALYFSPSRSPWAHPLALGCPAGWTGLHVRPCQQHQSVGDEQLNRPSMRAVGGGTNKTFGADQNGMMSHY